MTTIVSDEPISILGNGILAQTRFYQRWTMLAHKPISKPKRPWPLNTEGLHVQGMSVAEIIGLSRRYARAAQLAQSVKFRGVEIYIGHGFLLSQFLSPLFNHRLDPFGGSLGNRFRSIGDICVAWRSAVGRICPITIKIKPTDKLQGGPTTHGGLRVVGLLDQTSVDLIKISGGTYFLEAPVAPKRLPVRTVSWARGRISFNCKTGQGNHIDSKFCWPEGLIPAPTRRMPWGWPVAWR